MAILDSDGKRPHRRKKRALVVITTRIFSDTLSDLRRLAAKEEMPVQMLLRRILDEATRERVQKGGRAL